ncbi:hypothetical protein GTY67_26400 [Streptomyces sp. SID8374]|uniref:hypothetical protein n=1 Tax=Streptomyces sp. SID8374 TaxID=2690354 RepID=UPI001367EC2F|nr:hypothetical protein [Streptomyces sp. SID8374]MYX16883.1 hypothetical protein [Streptomyces sp. SID8374]
MSARSCPTCRRTFEDCTCTGGVAISCVAGLALVFYALLAIAALVTLGRVL